MVPVLCNVIGVDQNVIQVNYYAHVKEIREYIVHKTLEALVSPNGITDHSKAP